MLRTGRAGCWMYCSSVLNTGEDCTEDIEAPGGHNTGVDDTNDIIAGDRHRRCNNIP